ncbi:hypothetical protein A2U01_0084798, partial [Trifolium medium]|nr:hypothetical protein [Trifolium medium]
VELFDPGDVAVADHSIKVHPSYCSAVSCISGKKEISGKSMLLS